MSQVPQTEEEWHKIADGFQERWNFPMCIGAMDGKHILMKKPAKSGSTFFNYKHTFSIQLLAVVDAEYRFTYVDVGCQGRVGDAGVYNNCTLSAALEENGLSIPSAEKLPSTDHTVPLVLVADEAFPLKPYIMKPFARRGLNQTERVFNYRLSRARRVVENAFGILAARFRVFRSPLEVQPGKAVKVVLAATVLHNFLRSRAPSPAATHSDFSQTAATNDVFREEANACMTSMVRCKPRQQKATLQAKAVRNIFADYFMNAGQVPWQWNI